MFALSLIIPLHSSNTIRSSRLLEFVIVFKSILRRVQDSNLQSSGHEPDEFTNYSTPLLVLLNLSFFSLFFLYTIIRCLLFFVH